MIQITPQEMREMRISLAALEAILAKLDDIGAGIAAIHVDAAINQLKSNLEIVTEDQNSSVNEAASCTLDCPPPHQ